MQQMTENEIVKIFACVSYGYCDTCTHKTRTRSHSTWMWFPGSLAPWPIRLESQSSESVR